MSPRSLAPALATGLLIAVFAVAAVIGISALSGATGVRAGDNTTIAPFCDTPSPTPVPSGTVGAATQRPTRTPGLTPTQGVHGFSLSICTPSPSPSPSPTPVVTTPPSDPTATPTAGPGTPTARPTRTPKGQVAPCGGDVIALVFC
jgi:hypothetical protein